MKSDSPRILVSLTEIERDDFLSESERSWLRDQPNVRWLVPPTPDADSWLSELRDSQPEILVAAWKTPTLPAALLDDPELSLKYLCYLPGSIRKLVPREFIERGLTVTTWGNSISRTVSECALLLTLMALRRASHWALAMHREGKWKDDSLVTQSLFGRRVGLHGFGAISQALLPLLRPFDVAISAYSPSVPDAAFTDMNVRRADTLEDLFSSSDVLIELAPYTPKTHHLVGRELLDLLPDGAVFVNVGRGAVTDEAAVADLARSGRVQVALDVYENEPLPIDSPFRGLDNVTLLPHIAGPTRDRRCDAGAFAMQNLRNYLTGQPLQAAMTLDIYDRAS